MQTPRSAPRWGAAATPAAAATAQRDGSCRRDRPVPSPHALLSKPLARSRAQDAAAPPHLPRTHIHKRAMCANPDSHTRPHLLLTPPPGPPARPTDERGHAHHPVQRVAPGRSLLPPGGGGGGCTWEGPAELRRMDAQAGQVPRSVDRTPCKRHMRERALNYSMRPSSLSPPRHAPVPKRPLFPPPPPPPTSLPTGLAHAAPRCGALGPRV